MGKEGLVIGEFRGTIGTLKQQRRIRIVVGKRPQQIGCPKKEPLDPLGRREGMLDITLPSGGILGNQVTPWICIF